MPCSLNASVVPVYDSENVIMFSIFLIPSLTDHALNEIELTVNDIMCNLIGLMMLHVCKHVWL